MKDIEKQIDLLHSKAFDPLGLEVDDTLDNYGEHKMRSGGSAHLYNPQTIHLLQQSTRTGDYNLFKQYTELVNEEHYKGTLRSLIKSTILRRVYRLTRLRVLIRLLQDLRQVPCHMARFHRKHMRLLQLQ